MDTDTSGELKKTAAVCKVLFVGQGSQLKSYYKVQWLKKAPFYCGRPYFVWFQNLYPYNLYLFLSIFDQRVWNGRQWEISQTFFPEKGL